MSDDNADTDTDTAYDQGLANRRRVLGDAWVEKTLAGCDDFNTEFQSLVTRYAWHEVGVAPRWAIKPGG